MELPVVIHLHNVKILNYKIFQSVDYWLFYFEFKFMQIGKLRKVSLNDVFNAKILTKTVLKWGQPWTRWLN